MVIQAMWEKDSPVRQVPHLSLEVIDRLKKEKKVENVIDLMEMDDEDRDKYLNLSAKEMADVAKFCNRYPNIDVAYDIPEKTVEQGGQVLVKVQLEREEEDEDAEEESAEAVEEDRADAKSSFGRGLSQKAVGLVPDVLRGAELIERLVLEAEKTALLEVGRGDAPAAEKIAIEAECEGLAEDQLDVLLLGEARVGMRRELGERQAKRVEHSLRDASELEPHRPGEAEGAHEPRTDEADLNEVVEVTRLQ